MRQLNLFGQASDSATAKTSKQDAYQQITNKIIEAMKQGIVPWQRPWSGGNGVGYVSHSTGLAYSFLNAMLLMMAGKAPGEFITFRQCKEAGGHVKKGAKSTTIYFWKRLHFVEGKKVKNNGKPTGHTYKGYPVYQGTKGGYYVIRTSKKTGNEYKQYITTSKHPIPSDRGPGILERDQAGEQKKCSKNFEQLKIYY